MTNVLSSYRLDFYRRLLDDPRLDVHVFCQDFVPGLNLVPVHDRFPGKVTNIRFWSLQRERLGWQQLPLRQLLSFPVIFMQGNPRILSNVVFSLLFRGLGRSVVIWGQAHTGGGESSTERLRHRWWRAFRYLFVYNDGEVHYLRSRGFIRQRIIGMNNGLDQDAIERAASWWAAGALSRWQSERGLAGRIVVLSVARLEKKNRFDVFLEMLPRLLASVPDLLWCIVGDGPDREALCGRAQELGLGEHARFLGAIYREEELAPWFLSACCLVHPGAIGLSLLHAFGYGLPVVTHDHREGHMPEIYALRHGVNGLLYREGDGRDLIEKVMALTGQGRGASGMRLEARKVARERFNTRIMAERFATMALEAAGGDCHQAQ